MKILITLVTMLAVTGVSYAGPAVSDLGGVVGVEDISETAFQAPSAPVNAQAEPADESFDKGLSNAFCSAHPMTPGCPGYCKVSPAYPGCPLFCKDHHGHPACKAATKGISDDAETADKTFNEGLAKANCATNPGAPGCPLFCKDHHGYPGCPMYCQSNPWHPACGHVPAYCGTNPNGYGCPKSISAGDTSFDKDLAKAHCDAHPMAPGCPGYCKFSPAYPGCPLFCKDHHGHPACKAATKGISDDAEGDMKKVPPGYIKPPHPQWCSNHHGYPSCRKEASVAKYDCAYSPSAPGCPAYCASPGMQMQPGCPMYCAAYPSSPACDKE